MWPKESFALMVSGDLNCLIFLQWHFASLSPSKRTWEGFTSNSTEKSRQHIRWTNILLLSHTVLLHFVCHLCSTADLLACLLVLQRMVQKKRYQKKKTPSLCSSSVRSPLAYEYSYKHEIRFWKPPDWFSGCPSVSCHLMPPVCLVLFRQKWHNVA